MRGSTRGLHTCKIFSWLLMATSLAANSDLRLVDAVQRQDKTSIFALLKQRVDVNAPQADGATALAWAVHWNDLETVDLLIRTGANVNAANDYGVMSINLIGLPWRAQHRVDREVRARFQI